jgi:cell division initiation protein
MKITPLDIDQQEFSKGLRGYDPGEVRGFLNQVSRQLEEVVRENQRGEEQLRRQQKQLEEFRAHDGQLREALASAGRMTEEIRENATKEAELITAQAVIDGEKIVAAARTELARVSEESRSLKLQKTRLLSEIKTVVESHRRLLEAQEELDRQVTGQRKPAPRKTGHTGVRR